METLWQDARYAIRMLLKQPGFAITVVLTLAIGIGANTAIFSVVNAILLQPLPYREPDQLMKVLQTSATPGKAAAVGSVRWPYPRFEALRDQNESFAAIAAYAPRSFNLTGTEEPERLQCEIVSASYFSLLGIDAVLGRGFSSDEDKTPGTHPVAVIGHGLWQRRFGADPDVVGKTIELDKHSLTIVGVLPAGFKGQSGVVDLCLPTMMIPTLMSSQLLTQPRLYWAEVIARLKPDVTLPQAQAEMEVLKERIEKLFPGPAQSRPSGSGKEAFALVALKDANVDPAIRRSFLVLFAAVGFVLLIACANTAGLLSARAIGRRKEFAIRVALGASRSRVARQLLTESVLLALIGGAVGAVVALWGVDLLTKFKPSDNAQFWTAYARTFDFHTIAVDRLVLVFNFGLALATGLLFGLLPAWQASRASINEALKDSRVGAITGLYRRVNARSLLVVSEIALSLVLLAGAGLMINSLIRLNSIRLGFDPQNVLTMHVYSRDAKLSFYEQLLERASSLPGVISASVATSAPLYGFGSMSPLYFEEEQETEASTPRFVAVHSISRDYFNTLGITLIKGRSFTERDRVGAKRVGIINQVAAAQFWPDQEPIGKRFRLALQPDYPNADELVEIVGVSDNVKYGRVEELSEPEVYLSVLQPVGSPSLLVVRAGGDRDSLVAAIRREVKALDKNMPVYDVKSMSARAAEVTSRTRFSALVLALFAGVALILSGVGIYGVMAYTVAGRTQEIGIRMALGARGGDVFRLVCGQGIILTIAGLTIGLIGAYAATRLLANQLYEVSASDPITFAVISVVLIGVALGACFVPARRATKIDPMVALRYE